MSKLDRFLVSANFFEVWKDASVNTLSRENSDHCPIILKVGLTNFGPKSFKIFDHWMELDDFNILVHNAWQTGGITGSLDVLLKNKLKHLKQEIKKWSRLYSNEQ